MAITSIYKPYLFLMVCLLFISPSIAAPPVNIAAEDITSVTYTPNVTLGSEFAISFKVVNGTGEGVGDHACALTLARWVANSTQPMRLYQVREECVDGTSFSFTGESAAGEGVPSYCYLQSSPGGGFLATIPVSYSTGFRVSPQTGAHVGGYGSYNVVYSCGEGMQGNVNFTVLPAEEPTMVMDYARYIAENPAYIAFVLFGIMFIAAFLYWLLVLLGVK